MGRWLAWLQAGETFRPYLRAEGGGSDSSSSGDAACSGAAIALLGRPADNSWVRTVAGRLGAAAWRALSSIAAACPSSTVA